MPKLEQLLLIQDIEGLKKDPDSFYKMLMIKAISVIAVSVSLTVMVLESIFGVVSPVILAIQITGSVLFSIIYGITRSSDSLKICAPLSLVSIWGCLVLMALVSPIGDIDPIYGYFPLMVIAGEFLLSRKLSYMLYSLCAGFLVWQIFNVSPITNPTHPMPFIEDIIQCTMSLAIAKIFTHLKATQQASISRQKNEIAEKEGLLSIQRMAGNIAHELNNPLAIIQMISELIQKEKGNTPAHFFQSMETAIARITHIVDHFKLALKIDHINMTTSNLKTMVEGAIEGQAFNVSIQLDIPSDLRWNADFELVKVILLELIRNGEEAGATEIVIRATKDGRYGRLRVLDNGHGFGQDQEYLIKEPFQGRKTDAKGRGSGLFICKLFSVLMSMELTLKSNDGTTTACLRFPMAGDSGERIPSQVA